MIKTLLCCGLMLLFGVILTAGFPGYRDTWQAQKAKYEAERAATRQEEEKDAASSLASDLYVASYWLYWQQMQRESGKALKPSQVFLPDSYALYQSSNADRYQVSWTEEESWTAEEAYASDYASSGLEEFDATLESWGECFFDNLRGMDGHYFIKTELQGEDCLVMDGLGKSSRTEEEIREAYPYVWELSFDQDGRMVVGLYGMEAELAASAREQLAEASAFTLFERMDINVYAPGEARTPENMTVLFVMENDSWLVDYYGYGMDDSYGRNVEDVLVCGFGTRFLILLFLTVLLGLFLPAVPKLQIGGGWVGRIPFEIWFLLFGCALAAVLDGGWQYLYFVRECFLGNMTAEITEHFPTVSAAFADGLVLGLNVLLPAAMYGFVLAGLISLRRIITLGLKQYFQQNFLCVRLLRFVWKKIRTGITLLAQIDLNSSGTRWLLKVLAVNFLLVAFCCCLWFGGIAGAVIYSLFLFFFLQHYLKRIQGQYQLVQSALHEMVEGNLSGQLTEDLGPFASLGDELALVREGFRKAVDEEVRSRNLKTELITNVSHDLKTPLTAIITYINLLKDGTGTEEEKKEYIETLDRKAMRLKQLIEDLFEVSKAASGDMKINRKVIDVAELTRQVALELEDVLNSAQVTLRLNVPEGKVLAELDGSKMYRILENLLGNVAKYSLPGTRAYLILTADAHELRMELKNVSRNELSADVSMLKERLVRDDKARTTDGSGLGLTIVDSFVHLQGGSFTVEADGDLFKATVTLPRGNFEAATEKEA